MSMSSIPCKHGSEPTHFLLETPNDLWVPGRRECPDSMEGVPAGGGQWWPVFVDESQLSHKIR